MARIRPVPRPLPIPRHRTDAWRHRFTGCGLALALLTGPAGVARADGPAQGITGGITVAVDGDAPVGLAPAELAQLAAVTEAVGFASEHGPRQASFEGPLLWSVLDRAHAVPAKAGEQVRRLVLLGGSDGYTAVLALGEISPEFEGKPVLLALRMDGRPLEHPRIVVPGDRHGGRSVHDVVRVVVTGAK